MTNLLLALLLCTNAHAANKYHITVKPEQVYDGDTVQHVRFHLPFKIETTKTLRLLYVDAAEVRGVNKAQGFIARDWLRARVKRCKSLTVSVHGIDVFGRAIAVLYCGKENINNKMITEGVAGLWQK